MSKEDIDRFQTVRIERTGLARKVELAIESKYLLGTKADFAKSLIPSLALGATKITEASVRDSDLKLKTTTMDRLSPEAVATLACDIADAAINEIAKRGWLLRMPSVDEAERLLGEGDRVIVSESDFPDVGME